MGKLSNGLPTESSIERDCGSVGGDDAEASGVETATGNFLFRGAQQAPTEAGPLVGRTDPEVVELVVGGEGDSDDLVVVGGDPGV